MWSRIIYIKQRLNTGNGRLTDIYICSLIFTVKSPSKFRIIPRQNPEKRQLRFTAASTRILNWYAHKVAARDCYYTEDRGETATNKSSAL